VAGSQVGRADNATRRRMRRLLRKSVIFFENIDCNHCPWFASPTPPAMVEVGRFGILADSRPIRLGGRAFDLLLALIEAPGAVVGKDELSSRLWQGRIVDENRQPGTRLPRCQRL
jgi:hypothetical protein